MVSSASHLVAPAAPAGSAAAARDSVNTGTRARPAGPPIRVEWRDALAWAALREPWQDLACRALEPNVFYEPAFAIPAARAFGRGLGAVLVWSLQQPIRLLGLFPGTVAAARHGLGPPLFLGWSHPYAPLGTPLVDREEAAVAVSAWLDFLVREPGMPPCAMLPFLPEDGAFARTLAAVAEQRRSRQGCVYRHQRALLAPAPGAGAGYLERAISKKKRKELSRQRRKLLQGGRLGTRTAATPVEVPPALADFLTLEARGWKGRAGTAAQQDAPTRQFMREALAGLAAAGQVRIDRLMVAGEPIAASITLCSGASAWFWKIAYDERQAAASPGVQLALDMTRRLLEDPALRQVDSCATAGHPMIDRLWRERLAVSHRLIAAAANAGMTFRAALMLERMHMIAVRLAKRLRSALRPRWFIRRRATAGG